MRIVAINWSGPYLTRREINADHNGFYMIAGRRRYGRDNRIHYLGITTRPVRKRVNEHEYQAAGKLRLIRDGLELWIGEIAHPKKFKSHNNKTVLEHTEHALIYYTYWYIDRCGFNTSKTTYPPKRPITIISNWHSPMGEPVPSRPEYLGGFPDFLSWDLENWRYGLHKLHPN